MYIKLHWKRYGGSEKSGSTPLMKGEECVGPIKVHSLVIWIIKRDYMDLMLWLGAALGLD